MAEQEVSQADLFGQLEKADVKVDKKAAEEMKEKILKADTGQRWLGLGVYEVVVKAVELVKAKTGTMGIKFVVENEDGKAEVSMWLSEAALPYTIENVSRLVVHNAPDEGKDKARNFMSNIVSAKELYETMQEFIVNAEKTKTPFTCYLSVREAKDGSVYTDKNGDDKPSLERNLLSYQPKPTGAQAVTSEIPGAELVTDKDLDIKSLPF